MRVLAIEASGDWCGVAVGDGGSWHVREERCAQQHSERALALVAAALADYGCALSGLDGIAFGAGPGSFTGVRLACGVAQGLAFGADIPVLAVCTLEALAQQVWRHSGHENVLACIDARVREVYVAAYTRRSERWHEAMAPAVLVPAALAAPAGETWFGAGNGFGVDPALATRLWLAGVDEAARPGARAVGELALPRLAAGEGVSAGAARPLYVRHRIALTTAEREAGVRL